MKRVAENKLLIWSAALFIGYWLVGFVVPGPALSGAMSIAILAFGLITFIRYAGDTYAILFKGLRNHASIEGDGSHLAAYGVTLLSAGAVYTGIFGASWLAAGQPQDWLATPYSGFGRAMFAVGFALLYFSPGVTRTGLRIPSWYWILASAAIFGGLIGAFYMGAKMTAAEAPIAISITRAGCPKAAPVKGNISGRGRIYHEPSSLHYSRTIPERCFRSPLQARMAGYRPPG